MKFSYAALWNALGGLSYFSCLNFRRVFLLLIALSITVLLYGMFKTSVVERERERQHEQRLSKLQNLAEFHRVPNRLCETLIQASDSHIQELAVNDSQVTDAVSDSDYMNVSCEHLLRGYIVEDWLLPPEELHMSIAFAIHMYKDVWQFERLLRAIYRPHHFYCIHVDQRSSDVVFQAVMRIASCLASAHKANPNNVIVTGNRTAIDWGGISQVYAELTCMRELYKRSKKWKYFINLTGQEYALKTMWELVRILTALNGSNSMEARIRYMNDDRRQQLLPFARKYNITPVKGAIHIVVVREFVQFLLENPVSIGMVEHLKDAPYPDETYFATLNHNPNLRAPGSYLGLAETSDDVYPFINRLKNWGTMPCRGYYLRSICIWGVGDLPTITASTRQELFINKLIWNFQHFTLDCLEAWYWNKTINELTNYWRTGLSHFDVAFYANLSMSLNHI